MKISVCNCGLKKPWINFEVDKKQASKSRRKCFSAFTLAEMMVVMLIMSIILAAMAPVMTTRAGKTDNSSPWRYSPDNLSDAYFGPGDSQIAMIGQPNKLETDDAAKLIINSSDTLKPQISFKRNNTTVGRLMMKDKNLLLGDSTFDKHTSGAYNIAIGDGNLTELTTGNSNIAIGDGALVNNTSGSSNIALGTSLNSNTTGEYNVALGDDCLKENVSGSNNAAVGYYTLKNATGRVNTAIGAEALEAMGNGSAHVAVGYQALHAFNGSSADDQGNTSVGTYSMLFNETGMSNTALGYDALHDNASGSQNVSVGYRSNYYEDGLKSFSNTVAVGSYARTKANTSIAIGPNSTASNTDSIAIGNQVSASGESSIAIGSYASPSTTNASGDASIAIGDGARAFDYGSVAIGVGSYSYSMGPGAVAIGYGAQSTNPNTIAIGTSTHAGGDSGIAIGNNANTSAMNTVAIGNSATADYSNAVAIGNNSKAKGLRNVAIGYNACSNVAGHYKTCIGADSGPKSSSSWASSSDTTERIFIGSQSKFDNGTAVLEVHNTTKREPYINDYNINETAVVVHGSLIVTGPIYNNVKDKEGTWRHWQLLEVDRGGDKALWSRGSTGPFFREYIKDSNVPTQNPAPSDRRLKNVGKEFTSGLDKIRQLKVFNYTFKKDDKKTPHVGVIAQDLQKIFPNAVKKGTDGFLMIRMEDMFYAMINAIKELDLKYQTQEKRINDLEKQMKLQDKRLKQLEAKIK